MKLKRKVQAFTYGAILTSVLFSGVAMADTITVAKGDTLWELSQKHEMSVTSLKEVNGLKTNTIYAGQKLVLEKATTTNVKTAQTTSTTYLVQTGDSLYKIGKKFGIRYQDIQTWNNLSSTTIHVGQKLTLVTSARATSAVNTTSIQTVAPTSNSAGKRDHLIQIAKKLISIPYKWGGTTTSGFDCSGFMYYTLKAEGLVSSRTNVVGYWAQAKKVSNPVAGDLVYFQNTYQSGPSHMGIYLGNGQFIHAGSNGVAIESANSTYWKKHFLGYGTFF